jgi:hypothetical protein
MITSAQALKRFGDPEKEASMIILPIPSTVITEVAAAPARVYCNTMLEKPLLGALQAVADRGLGHYLKAWDGCFNIRNKRGLGSASLHSWGLAVDINAAWNKLGGASTQNADFIKCFLENGFEWGGNWTGRADPMHLQLAKL